MKMLLVLALLLTLNACQNPSRFQAAQPALGFASSFFIGGAADLASRRPFIF
jgi:hypothetical protein